MRYLLASLGSLGDLHPFLALARELATNGHDVELMSNAPYRDTVEREGVRFSPLCADRDHARTAAHPDLWHPIRGFGVLWRHLAVPAVDPVLERVRDALAVSRKSSEPITVLASPLAVGARLAREIEAFPLASVYTAPANMRPLSNPMFVGPFRVPALVPIPARRALWWGLDRWKLEPMARPLLEARCDLLGVNRPAGSIFGDWVHSPDGGLALFPPSFGPVTAISASAPIEQGDFPRFSAAGDINIPGELREFLEKGVAPVVAFGGSSPGPQGRALLRLTSQACRALGKRLVVLAPAMATDGLGIQFDNEESIRLNHAPLARLLPHAESFVHHGGVGSCAEGLEAGIPQVIIPFAFDQYDNAARVEKMHAGFVVRLGPRAAGHLLSAIQAAESLPQSPTGGRSQRQARGTVAVAEALRRWHQISAQK